MRIQDPGWKKFGFGMEKNSDPGWKKVGSGMEKSRIREKHPGSAALISGKDFVDILAFVNSRLIVQKILNFIKKTIISQD
jgi:hypothetical protein